MRTRIAVLFLALAVVASAQTKNKQGLGKKTGQEIQVTTGDVKTTNHQAVLTWTNPTTCTDGSPCTPVSNNVYKLIGTCGAATTQFTLLATITPAGRTYTDPNLAAATTYCYYVTASIPMPAAWSATVTYTGGQSVSYQGAVYVALNNASPNLNQPPNTAVNFWSVSSIESSPSNTAGGSTGTTGPPTAPSSLTITVQ